MSADAVIGSLKAVLGLDYAQFEDGLDAARKQLRQASRDFQRVGRELGGIGRDLTMWVTGPLALAGGAVVKTAADFESAMGRVSISTGAAGESLEAMSDLAREIGKETVFSATTAADAMDMLAKAGVTVEDILGGAARAAVDLAAAAGTDLDPAAAAITDTMAQFHKTAAELPGVVNQITGAVNESKLNFEDFQMAMGQAGGVAANLGVSFEDFNAVLAGTSPLFSSGSDAGTSFKTFLQRLVPTTEGAATAIQELGLSFHDAEGNLRPMREIAQQLKDSLSGLSDQAKTEALTEIFGTDAMRTAIALMDQGAEGLDRIAERIAATDAAAQAAKRMEGFNGQMEQLGGAFQEVAIAIGESGVLQLVTGLVTALADIMGHVAELNPVLLQVGVVFAGIAAAIGPVIMLVGGLVSAMGALTGAFAAGGLFAAGGALATIGTALGSLAAVALPVVAVVAGLVAAFLLFRDDVEPVLVALWETVQATLGPALGDLFTTVGDLVKGMAGAWMEFFDGPIGGLISKFVAMVVNVLGTVLVRGLTAAVRVIDGALKSVGLLFSILGDLLTGDFSGAWEGVKALVVNVVTTLGRVVEAVFPGALNWMRRLYEGVRDWLQNKLGGVFNWVGDKLKWVGDQFFKLYDAVVGHSYIPDMVEGIAAWMAKLDAGMVVPARNATEQTRKAFEDLRADVARVLEGLLTDSERAARDLAADMAVLDRALAAGPSRGGLSQADYDDAVRRRFRQYRDQTTETLEPIPVREIKPLTAIEDLRAAMNEGAEEARRHIHGMREDFADAFADGLEMGLRGDWKGMLQSILGDVVRGGLRDAGRMLFDLLRGSGGGGGGGGGNLLSSVLSTLKIPGFKDGVSFKVAGAGAPDSRLFGMRLSPGEMVDVRKPGQDAGPWGGAMRVVVDVNDDRFNAYVDQRTGPAIAASEGRAIRAATQIGKRSLAGAQQSQRRLGTVS